MTMYKDILFMENRGCTILHDEQRKTDMASYRTCARAIDKYGRDVFIETGFMNKYRATHKYTGKPLKKPVIDRDNALHVSLYYENSEGGYTDKKMIEMIGKMDLSYNKADILKAVNKLCGYKKNDPRKYTDIVYVSKLADNWPDRDKLETQAIRNDMILKCVIKRPAESLGNREMDIVASLETVEKLKEPGRNVYRFKSVKGNTFEFDKDRQTVTG